MDTAGIRHTTDTIEKIGVEKTYLHAEKASIALYLCDPGQSSPEEIKGELEELKTKSGNPNLSIITVINKTDQFQEALLLPYQQLPSSVFISAKNKTHLEELKRLLISESGVANKENENQLVTNARHASSLLKAETALTKVIEGMDDNLTSDFLALELKEALYQLGNITGEIYTDDLLGNIFSKFCIGK
jgi:tRNA modification GTPase